MNTRSRIQMMLLRQACADFLMSILLARIAAKTSKQQRASDSGEPTVGRLRAEVVLFVLASACAASMTML